MSNSRHNYCCWWSFTDIWVTSRMGKIQTSVSSIMCVSEWWSIVVTFTIAYEHTLIFTLKISYGTKSKPTYLTLEVWVTIKLSKNFKFIGCHRNTFSIIIIFVVLFKITFTGQIICIWTHQLPWRRVRIIISSNIQLKKTMILCT